MKNLWRNVEPKEVVPGVWAWENCIDVPEGIIDSMNKEVDDWKEEIRKNGANDKSSQYQTVTAKGYTGPVRFAPEP